MTIKNRKIVAAIMAAAIIIIMIIAMFLAPAVSATNTETVGLYTTQEIHDNPGILENRTPDTTIVEVVFGFKQNDYGDGVCLNTDSSFNYIWYDGRFSPGDLIVTFLVYDKDTQYTDDVETRLDFKVGTIDNIYNTSAYIRSFDDLPAWAMPEMREILDGGYIDGGTPYSENPDDINMFMADLKTIIVSYRMYKGSTEANVSKGTPVLSSPVGDTNRPKARP